MATMRYMVNDVEASIQFYITHLGFSLLEKMGPAFAMIEKDDLQIWLSGPQSSAMQNTGRPTLNSVVNVDT